MLAQFPSWSHKQQTHHEPLDLSGIKFTGRRAVKPAGLISLFVNEMVIIYKSLEEFEDYLPKHPEYCDISLLSIVRESGGKS